MTNGEKFKTAEERIVGWREYCKKYYSLDKRCSECPLWKSGECRFRWLDLESEEELEKCPFCGSKAKERKSKGLYYVFCTNCFVKTVDSITQDAAISAWNRRV